NEFSLKMKAKRRVSVDMATSRKEGLPSQITTMRIFGDQMAISMLVFEEILRANKYWKSRNYG
ncbi:MAG: hypothetical protein L3J05_09375, partial [Robiginitomaculum sp.]|nr:hypothetical protein [Robiginitomaculum sp.]